MADWEEELDDIEEQEAKKKKEEEAKKRKVEEEKKKAEKIKAKKAKEEQKKQEEKNKKEKEKNNEKKKDEAKKKEEEDKNKNIVLKIEKDYAELGRRNAEKIKNSKSLPIYTLAYLQNIVELLGPTLDSNQVNQLLNISNKIFNNKLNEGEKKKVSTKANLKVGKIMDRNDRTGEHNDDEYQDDEEQEEEEDEGQDFNIDDYI